MGFSNPTSSYLTSIFDQKQRRVNSASQSRRKIQQLSAALCALEAGCHSPINGEEVEAPKHKHSASYASERSHRHVEVFEDVEGDHSISMRNQTRGSLGGNTLTRRAVHIVDHFELSEIVFPSNKDHQEHTSHDDGDDNLRLVPSFCGSPAHAKENEDESGDKDTGTDPVDFKQPLDNGWPIAGSSVWKLVTRIRLWAKELFANQKERQDSTDDRDLL